MKDELVHVPAYLFLYSIHLFVYVFIYLYIYWPSIFSDKYHDDKLIEMFIM